MQFYEKQKSRLKSPLSEQLG